MFLFKNLREKRPQLKKVDSPYRTTGHSRNHYVLTKNVEAVKPNVNSDDKALATVIKEKF